MPTYEYKCLDCDRRFEVFQTMSEEPLTTCRDCNGRLKRLIGAGAGFIFKGSGFYATDYRSDAYRQAAKKESTTPAAASGGNNSTSAGSESAASTVAGSSAGKSESKAKSGSAEGKSQ